MSRKIGVLTENSGQGSRHSSVMNSDDSLHVAGCVSTDKKKEIASGLTAYMESQRQYFEAYEQLYDETQYLKAENHRRTEEMLQRAKEDLCKR
jgi:outer membrane murein-binding lipoprotein Lpp